jgi:CheY-like chemotaxis protein
MEVFRDALHQIFIDNNYKILMLNIGNDQNINQFSELIFHAQINKIDLVIVCDKGQVNEIKIKYNNSLLYLTRLICPHKLYNYLKNAKSSNKELLFKDTPKPLEPNIRILLVEDNINNQKIITKMLGTIGYNVDIANNGQEALEKIFSRHNYVLILMDCQMPVLDGYEATKLIKEKFYTREINRIPIIAITAHAMAYDKQKCLEAGMDDYLEKPISIKSLSSKINKWLSSDAKINS